MSVNWLLAAGIAALVSVPLMMPGEHEFSGADGQAQDAITRDHPDYQPWAEALWEPPSKEIESLLFALQAALGAGFLGFYFGRKRGRAEAKEAERQTCC